MIFVILDHIYLGHLFLSSDSPMMDVVSKTMDFVVAL